MAITPLSTRGSTIVDAKGKEVVLRGINWFGIETDIHVPHGLWARDYKDILDQIKKLDYNVIRLPFSLEALQSSDIGGIDFFIGSNKELRGLTPIEVMDKVIQEAAARDLMVILDSHTTSDNVISELWYDSKYSEKQWIDTWEMLTNRYMDQPNVIGADLKNEPHGKANWGNGDKSTDWRLAAERAGNAIHDINPNWLIFVEGIDGTANLPGQQIKSHWWGGNLEGVDNFPIRLDVPNKLVYSPHEYGNPAHAYWFNDPTFPFNLRDRWEKGFQYLDEEGTAPILIGEFGGYSVEPTDKEGIWQRQLVDFIKEKDLSFTYWGLNPNSDGTGGILKDDWLTVDVKKQNLLEYTLDENAPDPLPTLKVKPVVTDDWGNGVCIDLQITNVGKVPAVSWKMLLDLNDSQMIESWNGTFTEYGTDNDYTLTPPDWAKVIEPGETIKNAVGYCAHKTGDKFIPTTEILSL